VFSPSKPLLAVYYYMFFSVTEEILVPVSVTCVIRLSLFVLRHNYPEHVFIGEKSVFLWQEHGLIEMDYGGITSAT
jgi:predicted membrane protein